MAAATVTVVAMLGIFLAPALDACAGREEGTLACLRERVAELAGSRPEPDNQPVLPLPGEVPPNGTIGETPIDPLAEIVSPAPVTPETAPSDQQEPHSPSRENTTPSVPADVPSPASEAPTVDIAEAPQDAVSPAGGEQTHPDPESGPPEVLVPAPEGVAPPGEAEASPEIGAGPGVEAESGVEAEPGVGAGPEVEAGPDVKVGSEVEVPSDTVPGPPAEVAAGEVPQQPSSAGENTEAEPPPSLVPVGERAAREVAAAIAWPRDVAPSVKPPPEPDTEDPPASDRTVVAGRESEPAVPPPATEPVIDPPSGPPLPTGSGIEGLSGLDVLSATERARQEAAIAIAEARWAADIDPAPVADAEMEVEPQQGLGPDVLDSEVSTETESVAENDVTTETATPPDAGIKSSDIQVLGSIDAAPVTEDPAVGEGAPAGASEVASGARPPVDVRAIVRGWMEARAALETPGTAPGVASAPAAEVVPPPVKVAILVVPEVAAPAAPPPAESAAPAEAVPEVAATPPATATTPDPLAMVPTREAPDVTALLLSSADLARRAPGRIVVRPGDTLWDIAARVYGEGSRYRTIYEANRDILRRPGLLRPGQVLEIPLVYD